MLTNGDIVTTDDHWDALGRVSLGPRTAAEALAQRPPFARVHVDRAGGAIDADDEIRLVAAVAGG